MKFLKQLFNINHIVVVALAIALYELILLLAFNVPSFKPVGDAIKKFSMSDVYTRWERNLSDHEELIDEDIILVNTKDLSRREDFSKIIEKVYSKHPRVIGIDIMFDGEKERVSDSILLSTAANVCSSTIFACKLIDGNPETRTFKKVDVPFFNEAHVIAPMGYDNLNDNMEEGCIRTLSYKQRLSSGDTIESLPAAMLSMEGNKLPNEIKDFHIDYTPDFYLVDYDSLDYCQNLIEGRNVIIGDFDDEGDMHLTPLGKLPGASIHAYALHTLESHKQFIFVSRFFCWIISIIIGFLVEWSISLVKKWISRQRIRMRTFLSESLLPIRILVFLWLGIVGFGSFFLFWKFSIYIDTILPLALVAFVPEIHRLYNSAKHAFTLKLER